METPEDFLPYGYVGDDICVFSAFRTEEDLGKCRFALFVPGKIAEGWYKIERCVESEEEACFLAESSGKAPLRARAWRIGP